MIKKVNIFHLGKQPQNFEDQIFEVNLIKALTSEDEKELEYEPKCKFELESDDFNLDQIIDSAVEWATTPTPLSFEPIALSSTDQYPSSELKAFPNHLKNVYL